MINLKNQVYIDGRVIYILTRFHFLNVVLFDNFLSHDECLKLMTCPKGVGGGLLIESIEKRIKEFLSLDVCNIRLSINEVLEFPLPVDDSQLRNNKHTVVIHLNDIHEGGEIVFPGSDLSIVPRKGSGFVLSNYDKFSKNKSFTHRPPKSKSKLFLLIEIE